MYDIDLIEDIINTFVYNDDYQNFSFDFLWVYLNTETGIFWENNYPLIQVYKGKPYRKDSKQDIEKLDIHKMMEMLREYDFSTDKTDTILYRLNLNVVSENWETGESIIYDKPYNELSESAKHAIFLHKI